MDNEATERILTIVQLLAKCADHTQLDPTRAEILLDSVETLMKHDENEFVRKFLSAIKEARSVLSPKIQERLNVYP